LKGHLYCKDATLSKPSKKAFHYFGVIYKQDQRVFHNQFLVRGNGGDLFTWGGDSGAVVWAVDNDEKKLYAFGICWSKNNSFTAVCPLEAFFKEYEGFELL
jgi:hypothetical protein